MKVNGPKKQKFLFVKNKYQALSVIAVPKNGYYQIRVGLEHQLETAWGGVEGGGLNR